MIRHWSREYMRNVLTYDLGGKGTGGGQSLCGTSWDECADFPLPNGKVLSVMFSMDDGVAEIGLFFHGETSEEIMRYEGEPLKVLEALVTELVALGYKKPERGHRA